MNPLRTRTLFLAVAALAVSAPPLAARAQVPPPATPPAIDDAGAQGIALGIHAMLADMLGTLAPPADVLRATVQGDHYHVEIPIAHRWAGGGIGGDSIGADLTPLGNGRWRITQGAMPGRIEISVDHPPPNVPGATAITFKENSFSGIVDTTLATETALHLHVADENLSGEGGQTSTGFHMDGADGTLRVTPDPDGTVTLLSTSTMHGLKTTSAVGKQTAVNSVGSSSGTLRLTHLSFPALRAAARALSDLAVTVQAQEASAAPGAAPPTAPDPAQRADLHKLIAALAASAASFSMDGTQDDMVFGTGPVQGSIGHLGFGMDVHEQDGSVTLAMHIELDKPSFPAVPPGAMTEFLPRAIALKPRLSGIDAAALRRSLDAAVDSPQPNAFIGLVMAVLDAHPPTIAIDDLSLDTGPAHITAHGTLTSSGPSNTQGAGMVRATGFDAAMKLLSADPQGKTVMPELIFLKGLGKPDGDATVWDITYDGHKLLVNGNDISAMAPGAAAPPAK